MRELTPIKIVESLDKYIIGQKDAKKAVAVALRNRYRRSQLSDELREEITPKNIIMVGPTGVGKTEIARRMAKLVHAPFIKVEATKFTEVGYVGRDVESMIRDLVNTAIRNVKQDKMQGVWEDARQNANEIILDSFFPASDDNEENSPFSMFFGTSQDEKKEATPEDEMTEEEKQKKRNELADKLAKGELEEEIIEIEVDDDGSKSIGIMAGMNSDDLSVNMNDIFGGILPTKTKIRKVSVSEARKILTNQEAQKLIDMDTVQEIAIRNAEERGIIFIDEIDKIIGTNNKSGPDVSREGVQRDILPIVEGAIVNTKYGPIKTDYILFIGAGAFHTTKPSDLIPELQGRFPINVELQSLTEDDFIQILTQPENAIIKQYQELIKVEGVNLEFTKDAIDEIAHIAYSVNEDKENIGARRLHTVIEKLVEEISFYASDYDQQEFLIDKKYVVNTFKDNVKEDNINKYLI
jgi:ATP-dependent HslUV protease ATP-binding subunit HslU